MLVVKYKNKKIEGFNPKSFLLGNTQVYYTEIDGKDTYTIPFEEIDTIIVDGVELYKCPKEL